MGLPSSREADARYWGALAEGHLEMPRCTGCGVWHWPAVVRCGECGSWDVTWHPVLLEGSVFSWTRTWHPFAGSEAIAIPFVTVIVALIGADDRRLMGLLECDDIAIGDRVTGRVSSVRYGEREVLALKWHRAT